LIELDEHQRVTPDRLAFRELRFHLRRGRRESPCAAGFQRPAVRRLCARRDARRVLGRHRQSFVRRVKQKRLRPDPSPLAHRLRREFHRHVLCGKLRVRCDRDHCLRKRHAQLRREQHFTARRITRDLKRVRNLHVGRVASSRRWKRYKHSFTRARRRQRFLTKIKIRFIRIHRLDRRQTREDFLRLNLRQLRRNRRRVDRRSLSPFHAFAQTKAQSARPRHRVFGGSISVHRIRFFGEHTASFRIGLDDRRRESAERKMKHKKQVNNLLKTHHGDSSQIERFSIEGEVQSSTFRLCFGEPASQSLNSEPYSQS